MPYSSCSPSLLPSTTKFSLCFPRLCAEVVNAQNIGLQGDVAVEQGDYEKAAKLFAKAVKSSDNNYTAPHYLYKQALALVAAGKGTEAKACYKAISEKYPNSIEARDAEKALGSL